MALDIWFPTDVQRVITGLLVATVETTTAHGIINADHVTGQIGAYRAMAASFGLVWGDIVHDARADVGRDIDALLGRLLIDG